jgi:AbrB family looped-hinge helix DNA binding protein
MATIMKISPQGQIRLPKKIMSSLQVESGDYVEVDVSEGQIVLKPRKLINPSQGWYWTREWQEKEAESEADLEKGRLSPKFKTAKEGVRWLKK